MPFDKNIKLSSNFKNFLTLFELIEKENFKFTGQAGNLFNV